jgi:hypothetical protein
MSRIRYLKPGFFKNELLAECDPLARILFAGLWTEADRDGRLEDRPRRLKAELLPYDDCDPEALLAQLHQRGFIMRYTVANVGYIAMPTWYAHQRPHKDEHSRGFPGPPKRTAKSADLQASREIIRTSSEKVDTEVYGELGTVNGELVTGNGSKPSSTAVDIVKRSRSNHDGFDDFWRQYPKKAGKKEALARWRRMDEDQRQRATVVAQAVAYAVENGYRELTYVPMGSTFLNAERYEDWYDDGELVIPGDYAPSGNGKKKQRDIDDSIARAINSVEWPEEAS